MDFSSIVLDNGTHKIKVGYAGDDEPRVEFRNIIGKVRESSFQKGQEESISTYIGDEVLEKMKICEIEYPVQNGIIKNWENMETVWDYLFYTSLGVDSSENPILFLEQIMNPKKNREKVLEVLFEKYNVPATYIEISPLMSIYASGRYGGIIIDIGDETTAVAPFYEIYGLNHAFQRTNFSGSNITKHLLDSLYEKDIDVWDSKNEALESVRSIKETLGYVAMDYEEELERFEGKDSMKKNFTTSSGEKLELGEELFKSAEILFKPKLAGVNLPGIHEMLYDSIIKCDLSLRRDLCLNLIVSGGTTLMTGFPERLKKEMELMLPSNMRINVIAPKDRIISNWIGGSILASLSTFQSHWLLRGNYEEEGPQVVHHKTFNLR